MEKKELRNNRKVKDISKEKQNVKKELKLVLLEAWYAHCHANHKVEMRK